MMAKMCIFATDMRKWLVIPVIILTTWTVSRADTAIMGEPQVDPEVMAAFVLERNPGFDPAIAHAFVEIGRRYGIRGDIALCQAILETGWFRFADGTAVKPDQHNYCGLGVTRRGLTGASFESIEAGVAAMMQHLYAYSCDFPLPESETLLDPRFGLVTRGCATTWEALSNRWAANPDYGKRILDIYRRMTATDRPAVETIEVVIPDGLAETDSEPDRAEHPEAVATQPVILF